MNEETIPKIINDPATVTDIINTMAKAFPSIYKKYNKEARDPYTFYMTGHCLSFALILYEIFNGEVTIMDSKNHVITKIGKNHFDIRGFIDGQENIEEYKECPIEYLPMVEVSLGNKADHDKEITIELIEVGKNKIEELSTIIEEKTKRKKSR